MAVRKNHLAARCLLVVLLFWVIFNPSGAFGGWVIQTIAGNGNPGDKGNFESAKDAQLDNPFGVTRGPDGALWFTEYGGHRVRKILKDGTMVPVAGNGKRAFEGDNGPAMRASLNMPHEIRFDPFGNWYIADMGNHVVRKVDGVSGTITSFVGTGLAKYGGDGNPANLAYLRRPISIQFSRDACLYICDPGDHVVRRVNMASGIITTFAGTRVPGPTPDGAPIFGTPLKGPRAIEADREGNLWVATSDGNQIFKFETLDERIRHIAGTGGKGYSGDGGPARDACFNGPKGISLDAEGNIWVADTENHVVRRIDAKTRVVQTVAGTGERGNGEDGPALQCKLARPHGVFADKDGAVYVSDSENHKLRVIRYK